MAKAKKQQQERIIKRYYADCCNCTAHFQAERAEDMQKYCSCGQILTWNDTARLKTLEGVRECKK